MEDYQFKTQYLDKTYLPALIKTQGETMKLEDMIREMIESELEEAGAVGSEMMLQTMQGTLSQIITKYGGDYNKAQASPEWKTAIANGDQALKASTAPTLVKPMQTTGAPVKKTLQDLRPSNQNLAQKQQAAALGQQQRSQTVADKLRAQRQAATAPQMESVKKVDSTSLVETIRALVKEALEGTE